MKFLCRCGNILSDSTDLIPYKGHLIADQDWFDLWDRIDEAVKSKEEDREKVTWELMSDTIRVDRILYQCPRCGHLYMNDAEDKLHEFSPQETDCTRMLESVRRK